MTRNRLDREKSPYLQQHADNPVDWHPWGEEAFSRAAAEDKPIFLSIGYATCHWCHVMERESFEDEAAAKVLNDVLSRLTGDPQWENRARKLAASVAGTVGRQPTAFTRMLTGLDLLLFPSREIVITGSKDRPDTQAMLKAAGSRMIAADALILKDEDTAEALARVAPFTGDMALKEDRAMAYVCSGQRCDAPVTDPEELAHKLGASPAQRG